MPDNSTPHGVQYDSHRPVIMGRRGMVSSAHPLASQAGISILQRGGNAVDAAIAIAASLNVTEPLMSGIGGDGYIMIYMKETGNVSVINATGAAPYAATLRQYSQGIPMKGILSTSVPGLLRGWSEAHQKYGRLKLGEVLDPAIDLAQNGFPVSHVLARAIANDPLLQEFPTSKAVFTRKGRPLLPGEILYQENLARTFERISHEGASTFYEGEIADAIVRFSDEQGGLLTQKDLVDCKAVWQEAISTTYHGHTVYEAPPNSSGHVLLQELNLAECFDLRSLSCNSAESVHLMVEMKKLAFADREAYLADPNFVDVPIPGLLSKEYAKERAATINTEKALEDVTEGNPWLFQSPLGQPPHPTHLSGPQRENTTCFVVVDQWGNAVSMLQSIQTAWGSSLIAGETGILLNNRMTYWHLDPKHIDCLQPGKRVRHTMNPVMVFENTSVAKGIGDLFLVCGTPGADTQVQTNFQVVTHVIDHGMTVAEAVEAPRWRHIQDPTESTIPHTCEDELRLESRFTSKTGNSLKKRGHNVNFIGDWAAMGNEVMIQVNTQEGSLHGAADPRSDGYALGW